MKISKFKYVSAISLTAVVLASCSNKSNFSSKDAPVTKLDNIKGSGAAVSKSGDSLQQQLNELKAKVEAYYKEFGDFAKTVDVRFASIDQKLKDQIAALTKEIARVESKVDSLSAWRDSEAKPLFDSLLVTTSTINKTIKEMNVAHNALSDKLAKTDQILTERLDKMAERVTNGEKDMVAFKNEVALTYATKEKLGKVEDNLAALNKSMVSMYTTLDVKIDANDKSQSDAIKAVQTDLNAKNKALTESIGSVQNDLNGLKGEFTTHVEDYKKTLEEQKGSLQSKFDALKGMISASDFSNSAKLDAVQAA